MWNIGIYGIKDIENTDLKEEFPLHHFKYVEDTLTWKQRRLLKKYGTKMEALMDGKIVPLSERGKHFVAMCKGLVEPDDGYERAWKKYILNLEEENKLAVIHRTQPIDHQRREQYIQSLFLGNPTPDAHSQDNPVMPDSPKEVHARDCIVCRGSGMKGDGDNCDRCNGRGWIEH